MEPRSEASQETTLRLGMRLFGLAIAVVAGVALMVVYVITPHWLGIPALVAGELALPAVAATLGLFQAATGMPLWEIEDQFSDMSLGKRLAIVLTLLLLLGTVLGAFMWFVGLVK